MERLTTYIHKLCVKNNVIKNRKIRKKLTIKKILNVETQIPSLALVLLSILQKIVSLLYTVYNIV